MSRALDDARLPHVIDSALAEINRDGLLAESVTKPEEDDPASTDLIGSAEVMPGARRYGYDPSVVYLFELCTVLCSRNAASAAATARPVINALMHVLRGPSQFDGILVARAAYYTFSLLHTSYVS